jgi:hypothetical protein
MFGAWLMHCCEILYALPSFQKLEIRFLNLKSWSLRRSLQKIMHGRYPFICKLQLLCYCFLFLFLALAMVPFMYLFLALICWPLSYLVYCDSTWISAVQRGLGEYNDK